MRGSILDDWPENWQGSVAVAETAARIDPEEVISPGAEYIEHRFNGVAVEPLE